jgi:hypothetical protein
MFNQAAIGSPASTDIIPEKVSPTYIPAADFLPWDVKRNVAGSTLNPRLRELRRTSRRKEKATTK